MSALTAVIAAVADDVIAAREELNRLDGVAGDGDLGITMTNAATALQEILPTASDQNMASLLRQCGAELARRAPSTSGTLVATGFLRAAQAVGSGEEPGVVLLVKATEAAMNGIQERGKVALGDKTMVDALGPAIEALRRAAHERRDVAGALADAAVAAQEGAERTAEMRAKVGRAGWLADRSDGHIDAGARLVAIAFASAARHAAAQ